MMKEKDLNRRHCIYKLSAKYNREENKWLPLTIHSNDTSGVAEYLLNEWLPTGAREAIRDEMSDEQLTRVIRFIALAHDFGKISYQFQSRIAAQCTELKNNLWDVGLDVTRGPLKLAGNDTIHHSAYGEVLLLEQRCPISIAAIIGAHHGQTWERGFILDEDIEAGDYSGAEFSRIMSGETSQERSWKQVQDEFAQWIMDKTGIRAMSELPQVSTSSAVLLTGLLIMADWIASNVHYFPLLQLECISVEDEEARIRNGMKKLNLPLPWRPSFRCDPKQLGRERFGFELNEIQSEMAEIATVNSQPGIMILEAPMGIGKTEAALLTAEIFGKDNKSGIFFGLPTQATANGIFNRVTEWGKSQSEHTQNSIRLAHGMANLNAQYRELMKPHATNDADDEDTQQFGLIAHEWFNGTKQALLASFVVGTVDQVLMAALKQKHVMLRHLGLGGKTIIVDECHAYDTYMNQYLEGALQWMGKYKIPVIMLSATLPQERRSALIDAYAGIRRTDNHDEEWRKSVGYPLLTWTEGKKVLQKTLPCNVPRKNVQITKSVIDDGPEEQIRETITILREKLNHGGCAAVVLNTVKRAQLFYEAIHESMPEYKVLLLHSRYVMADRLEHEETLLKLAGKSSEKKDRDQLIIIGTQVIEQSLDFDVDYMISDLCPIDLLLQRIGRLHRHAKHDIIRPKQLKQPSCHVLCAGKDIEEGAKEVYGEFLLLRTKSFLPDKVMIPDDISVLVQKVYDRDTDIVDADEQYIEAKGKETIKINDMRKNAKVFRILPPNQLKPDIGKLLSGSVQNDEDHARAQVRNGDMSVSVLAVVEDSSGNISFLPWRNDSDVLLHPEQCPDEGVCRKLLGQRVSLPGSFVKRYDDEIKSNTEMPEGWKASTWLRRERLLRLDENLQSIIGNDRLTYSYERGLYIDRL